MRSFANLYDEAVRGVAAFREEVTAGEFPADANAFKMKEGEFARLRSQVECLDPRTSESPEKPSSAPASSASSSAPRSEAPSFGCRKVCVRGGGRMGQLFAWLLAGEASSSPAEVVLASRRKDLQDAVTENGGLLFAAENSGPEETPVFSGRAVRVCTPEELEASGERFDFFVIACASRDTQQAGEETLLCSESCVLPPLCGDFWRAQR